ncbi:CAP domain-containing protein [Actinoplanes friuliensis]|uniref:RNA polymerase ECF-subfamily sigma factor n=1 Tax=Actinoplanes friuliensis DSM 7358 TaxID=1246995 RepID=U5VSJ9_9ACTN|nr:CAP domain-containing protein [Actinoplanes friuliensis]AGZ39792.1 RNA polymerase ECF-subfamily sigma factor [Actinoplanes friuliensis DSM 7358]
MRRPVLIVGGMAVVTVVAGIAVAASASAGTTTYEAEASVNSLAGGAHAVDCGRCSGGKRITGIGAEGVLTITGVVAEKDGPTRLAVTYTGERARTAQISVNGAVPTAIRFPGTRGTNRPATLRLTATLKSGDNNLTFGNSVGPAPDIDKVVITTDGTPPTTAPTATASGEPGATATVTPTGTAPPTLPTSPPATSPAPTSPAPTTPSASPTTKPPATTEPPTDTPTKPPATSPAPTTPPATPPTGNAALEAEVVRIVNVERAKANCPALTADDKLTTAARGHSADMAARNYFSHTTPEGVEFATRITNAGYRWSGAGENIAKGQRTPADVMTSWMNSAGHKANILNCGFKNIGVGVAADAQGSLVWTQDFASPR